MRTYFVSVLSVLYMLSHLILTKPFDVDYFYDSDFTDNQLKAQRS